MAPKCQMANQQMHGVTNVSEPLSAKPVSVVSSVVTLSAVVDLSSGIATLLGEPQHNLTNLQICELLIFSHLLLRAEPPRMASEDKRIRVEGQLQRLTGETRRPRTQLAPTKVVVL